MMTVDAVSLLVFGGLSAFGAMGYLLFVHKQSKPQIKFEVSIREDEHDPPDTHLYYVARNVGLLAVHMEWFGLRLAKGDMFFHRYFVSSSMEIVPFVMPMKRRKRKEILPGRAYDTSIELEVFTQFLQANGFRNEVKVTPYLGDERGVIYKGKSFRVPLNGT